MARSLTIAVFCLCLAVAFAADLRKLIADRAAGVAPPVGKDGKASGDLDTASSFGWGWGGPGWGYGGPWGYGWGGPWGYGGYGGYGGWGWGGYGWGW